MKILVKCLVCFVIITQSATAENNWPRWRGPNSDGTAALGIYPVKWDSEKVLWRTDIPGKGFSTPIVWEKQIYLTTGTDGLDTVLAIDWSGKQIWRRQLGAEIAGKHTNGSGSNPSAVTDGSAVFVFFKSGNFAALELDGSIRWKTNLFERFGKDDRYWDFGTSPVLTEKDVVIAEMHDGDSWVAAFDKMTGELHWKVPRNYETPREGKQGYGTPIVFSHKGIEALLIWGGQHLTAHDASDGKTIWTCGGFNPEANPLWPSVASPVICGTIAVVPCGRADRNQPRLHGIKLGGSGDITETHRLWERTDTGPFIPTPTEYEGRVYVINDRGQIDCIDPSTGKSIWSGVFPRGKGNFYSSPLIAGGHLYAAREDGMVYVVKLGDQFEIVSEINMPDRIIASPIAVSGRLLIRTSHHLFCVGDIDVNTPSDNDGWTSLFNGKDLTGWEVKCLPQDRGKGFWKVNDGAIECDSIGIPEHNYVWLTTEEEFSDFHLRLKFQVFRSSKGNSGLQFRSRYEESNSVPNGGWLNGPQIDIHPPTPFRTGLIYDETLGVRRWIYPSLRNSAIVLEQAPPAAQQTKLKHADADPDVWNTLDLICDGMKIKTVVNGELVSDYDATGILDDETHRTYRVGTNGKLALQLHSRDELLIRFKDIAVRKMD